MGGKNQNKAKVWKGIQNPLTGTLEGITAEKTGVLRAKRITPRKKRKKLE